MPLPVTGSPRKVPTKCEGPSKYSIELETILTYWLTAGKNAECITELIIQSGGNLIQLIVRMSMTTNSQSQILLH
ncbi:unnamed protein product [Rotaria sordida]|uniref:Uncharacterized protein n=1 Tax=Rotaria sordida TaxID=392033 RepID=A0A819FDQ9_9BILA|nr:unnamed protein product [Rotaria sordida]